MSFTISVNHSANLMLVLRGSFNSWNVFFGFQIQHPRSRLDRFDLVVTPRHDYHALTVTGQQEVPRLFRRWVTPQEPPGRNVVCCFLTTLWWKTTYKVMAHWLWILKVQVLTVGALHQADSAALRLAAIAWHDELAPLPKPFLIVNIGGPTGLSYCTCCHICTSFNIPTHVFPLHLIDLLCSMKVPVSIWSLKSCNC
jgi:mitochondrial fission protein ELM1